LVIAVHRIALFRSEYRRRACRARWSRRRGAAGRGPWRPAAAGRRAAAPGSPPRQHRHGVLGGDRVLQRGQACRSPGRSGPGHPMLAAAARSRARKSTSTVDANEAVSPPATHRPPRPRTASAHRRRTGRPPPPSRPLGGGRLADQRHRRCSSSRRTKSGLPLGHSTARPQTSQTASSG
jgi:hypothetical protein